MSRPPRRPLTPPSLDEHDAATIEKTKVAAGIKPPTSPAAPPTTTAPPAPPKSQGTTSGHVADPGQKKPSPPKVETMKLSQSDLRPLIAPSGELAAALASILSDIDPAARQHIKPVSILKRFMDQNDAALAKMILEQHNKA
ncbi:MAG: hypothetical protein KKB02_03285 [Alphaproteobacteria bacterium]|nr:hypothetical protein [Alphaproteobacteria bacterium]